MRQLELVTSAGQSSPASNAGQPPSAAEICNPNSEAWDIWVVNVGEGLASSMF